MELREIFTQKDFGYKYPEDLNMRPGSQVHKLIIEQTMNRARDSFDRMKTKHEAWRKVDRTMNVFTEPSLTDSKARRKDPKAPVGIVVPLSYAVLDTILTYFSGSMLELPYFRFQGQGPEDEIGATLLENVVAHQNTRFEAGLALHTFYRDAFCYGFGAVHLNWRRKYGRSGQLMWEGNDIENIDSYSFLPDPNVPIHRIQDGEFVGWVERTNFMRLLRLEEESEGRIFNVKYLEGCSKGMTSRFSSYTDLGREDVGGAAGTLRLPESYSQTSPVLSGTAPIDVIHMYVMILPAQWKINDSRIPQIWSFSIAADEYVIRAEQLQLEHDMYPVVTYVPDFDGHSLTPTSRMEIIYGLQEHADFFFTSHVTNVRKAINDMLVYDPFLIESKDLADPRPGRLIPLKRPGWGVSLDNAVKQLQVVDVTQNHISRDLPVVNELIQRVSSASDSVQGMMRQGSERISAQEFRSTQLGAISRLQKAVKLCNMMAMQKLGFMQGMHTQQFMSKRVWITLVGEAALRLQKEYGLDPMDTKFAVMPEMINVSFDVMPKDETIPGQEFVDSWIQLYQAASANPQVAMRMDFFRVFLHIARLMGAKNAQDFELKAPVQVMPDADVEAGVQAGNLAPVVA